MYRILLFSVAVMMSISPAVGADDLPAAQKPELSPTAKSHASYGIGLQIGRNLAGSGFDTQLLDSKQFLQGVLDSLGGKDPAVSDAQLEAAMTALDAAITARRASVGDKNKRAGEEFLAANAKKPGVKVLPSGLQYKVLATGTGPSPKLSDEVKTHYEGRLIDGTVFDSSIARGEPAVFPVSRVIRGWVEALQLMKVGDKWQLYVPSDMAYGDRGAPGGVIGPHSVLIFDIELLGIEK